MAQNSLASVSSDRHPDKFEIEEANFTEHEKLRMSWTYCKRVAIWETLAEIL